MSLSIGGLGAHLPEPIGPTRGDSVGPTRGGPNDPGAADGAVGRDRAERAATQHASDTVATSTSPAPTGAADPEMWALLSSEERSFYLRHALQGPATYDPSVPNPNAETSGARLGARIDLRI